MIDLNAFFQREGLNPKPHFFNDTNVFIGWNVMSSDFEFVYKQDKNRLVICSFNSVDDSSRSVLLLRNLLRKVLSNIPGISYIDALVLPSYNNDTLNSQRTRLVQFMLNEGGSVITLDGHMWLRINR